MKNSPSKADASVEELRNARLKLQAAHHIFVFSKLFIDLWLKQLNKSCDFLFELTASFTQWNQNMFKPLVFGVFLFIPHSSWKLKGTPKMFSVVREVRNTCKTTDMDSGNFCVNFFDSLGNFPPC